MAYDVKLWFIKPFVTHDFWYWQMITKNFEDYPEHRLKFFSLLRAIASHCFRALFKLSGQVITMLLLLLDCSDGNVLTLQYLDLLAIEASDGFDNLGISAHGKECCRDRVESSPRHANKFSGRL